MKKQVVYPEDSDFDGERGRPEHGTSASSSHRLGGDDVRKSQRDDRRCGETRHSWYRYGPVIDYGVADGHGRDEGRGGVDRRGRGDQRRQEHRVEQYNADRSGTRDLDLYNIRARTLERFGRVSPPRDAKRSR